MAKEKVIKCVNCKAEIPSNSIFGVAPNISIDYKCAKCGKLTKQVLKREITLKL